MKRTIKVIEDELIKKSNDTDSFLVGLYEGNKEFNIPNDAIVKVIILKGKNLVAEKEVNKIKDNIIELNLSDFIGDGLFSLEIKVIQHDTHRTFPNTDEYAVLRILRNLSSDAAPSSALKSDMEVIIGNIDSVTAELRSFKESMELHLAEINDFMLSLNNNKLDKNVFNEHVTKQNEVNDELKNKVNEVNENKWGKDELVFLTNDEITKMFNEIK